MRSTFLLLLLPVHLFAQQNDPQLTARMNAQMTAQRPAAVFEENKGQMKDQYWQPRPDVLFNGSANGMAYYVRDNGMSYQLSRVESWKEEEHDRFDMPGTEKRQVPDEMGTYRVDVQWTDFNADYTVEKGTELPGYTNYYNVPEGVEPALFVKQYESVTLRGLYDGIDLHLYGTDGHLETDWLVAPGADYTQISFEVKGAALSVDAEGHLIMGTPFGEIREGTLKVFQEGRLLEAYWRLSSLTDSSGTVSFEVMGHDPMLAMRIDPYFSVRLWATYYGDVAYDRGFDCAVDNFSNVFLAGETQSQTGISHGGHQNDYVAMNDAFLVKFDANGGRLWATYYGGVGDDHAIACATDGEENVFIAGRTDSPEGIAANGHQNSYGGGSKDSYIVKFNTDGIRQWSTYLGGSELDAAYSCRTDTFDNVYLAGVTSSTTGIAFNGYQVDYGGGDSDAFLAKFDAMGIIVWSTYYGGHGDDYGLSCTTDPDSGIYISGGTSSASEIAFLGHEETHSGEYDAFLAKFSADGERLWATYYGGTENDHGRACAASNNTVYLVGSTESLQGIAANGYQSSFGGGEWDAFAVKFDENGLRLWGTYYGGHGTEDGNDCEIDSYGNVYIVGETSSTASISTEGYQPIYAGGLQDAYIVKLNGEGTRMWATYFGGSGQEFGLACSINGDEELYMAGFTNSSATVALDGHQNTAGGWIDAFLVKFKQCPDYEVMILGLPEELQLHSEPIDVLGVPEGGVLSGSGLSGNSFSPIVAGVGEHCLTYSYTVNANCTKSVTQCVTVSAENSINENQSGQISISPNPGGGLFTIALSEASGLIHLTVIDITGREVLSEQFTTSGSIIHTIDMSGQANGIYTLRIETEKGTGGVRLVKE